MCAAMMSPKHAMVVSMAVPPYEINGKGIPTTGNKPNTMPTLNTM